MNMKISATQEAETHLLEAAKEFQKCMQCGKCRSVCPVFREMGNELYVARCKNILAEKFTKVSTAKPVRQIARQESALSMWFCVCVGISPPRKASTFLRRLFSANCCGENGQSPLVVPLSVSPRRCFSELVRKTRCVTSSHFLDSPKEETSHSLPFAVRNHNCLRLTNQKPDKRRCVLATLPDVLVI